MKKIIEYKNSFNMMSASIFEDNLNNPYALDQLLVYGRRCMKDANATDREVYLAVREALDEKYLPLLDMLVLIYAPKYA